MIKTENLYLCIKLAFSVLTNRVMYRNNEDFWYITA